MALVDWVTSQQVKDQLEIAGTNRDTALAAAITAASRALNARCQRELTPQAADATRTFRVLLPSPPRREPKYVDLRPYDLRTPVTHVKLRPEETSPETLVADEDYALMPIGTDRTTGTYTGIQLASDVAVGSVFASRFGYAQLEVRAPWGAWDTAAVPEDVKRACVVTVGSWLDKAVAEYGESALDEARPFQRPIFAGYAIPTAALRILAARGLVRTVLV